MRFLIPNDGGRVTVLRFGKWISSTVEINSILFISTLLLIASLKVDMDIGKLGFAFRKVDMDIG